MDLRKTKNNFSVDFLISQNDNDKKILYHKNDSDYEEISADEDDIIKKRNKLKRMLKEQPQNVQQIKKQKLSNNDDHDEEDNNEDHSDYDDDCDDNENNKSSTSLLLSIKTDNNNNDSKMTKLISNSSPLSPTWTWLPTNTLPDTRTINAASKFLLTKFVLLSFNIKLILLLKEQVNYLQ